MVTLTNQIDPARDAFHMMHEAFDVVFVPADNDDDHAVAFYAEFGGRPAAVTMCRCRRTSGRHAGAGRSPTS